MTKYKRVIMIVLAMGVALFAAVTALAETVIFDPGASGLGDLRYSRAIELRCDEAGGNKGNYYITCEYWYGAAHFPIYESKDKGKSFHHISDIYETEYNQKKYLANSDGTYREVALGTEGATSYYNSYWVMKYSPSLYELPEDIGEFKKGTVLCAGLIRCDALKSAIVIYYSDDGLRTWHYASTVAEGGALKTANASAIWEGNLISEGGALYCFYSDERNMNSGGQKLVFEKTYDIRNWSSPVDVCNFEKEKGWYRPGMPVVTKMQNGNFMMVYEGVNMGSGYLPDYYKVTNNIEQWNPTSRGTELPKTFQGGSPFCTTLDDGRVIVGAHGTTKIGVNTNNGASNEWRIIDTDINTAYSRCLCPLSNGDILISSGGPHATSTARPRRMLSYSIEHLDWDAEIVPISVTGSTPWNGNTANSAVNVIDNNNSTYFDGVANGYVILDFGKVCGVTGLGYTPRNDMGERMVGGVFYGSNDKNDWTVLHTVSSAPANGSLTYVSVKEGRYRYIKYTSDGTQMCNLAEINVYGYRDLSPQIRLSGNNISVSRLDGEVSAVFAKYQGGEMENVYTKKISGDTSFAVPKGFENSKLMLFDELDNLSPKIPSYDVSNETVYLSSKAQNRDSFYSIGSSSGRVQFSFDFVDNGSVDSGIILGSNDAGLHSGSSNYFASGSIVINFAGGELYVRDGGVKKYCAPYTVGERTAVHIDADIDKNVYDIYIGGDLKLEGMKLRTAAQTIDTLALVENIRGGIPFDLYSFKAWKYVSSKYQNADALYPVKSFGRFTEYNLAFVDNGSNDSGIMIGGKHAGLNINSGNYFASGSIVLLFDHGSLYYRDKNAKVFCADYTVGESVDVKIIADTWKNKYDLYVGGSLVAVGVAFRTDSDVLDTLALVENRFGANFELTYFKAKEYKK